MAREQSDNDVMDGLRLRQVLDGYTGTIGRIAWSPDGQTLAAPAQDGTVRLWDVQHGHVRQLLKGHAKAVNSVAWAPDGSLLASASTDRTVAIWDAATGKLVRVLKGHRDLVTSVAWSPDEQQLASGSNDATIILWNVETGKVRDQLEGHARWVTSLAWWPGGWLLASGSGDKTIRLWDPSTQHSRILKGHTGRVTNLAWSPRGDCLASCSYDSTIRLWKTPDWGKPFVLEGHLDTIRSVAFSPDGDLLASKSWDRTIRLWRPSTGEMLGVLSEEASYNWAAGLAFHPREPVLATLGDYDESIRIWDLDLATLLRSADAQASHYANAKVVLVGDSGVGKSGLGLVLTGQPFTPTESTHGRCVWTLAACDVARSDGLLETRETLLWDLAGQPGYRVLHRQHLDEAAVALVLFDSRSETDPFAGVTYWARALDEATQGFPLVKLLVAARVDRGGPPVSEARIREVCARYGFTSFFQASAKRGDGIEELRQAIGAGIAWEKLARISSPRLFHDMKAFLIEEKKAGRVFQRREELLARFRALPGCAEASEEAFLTCLGRLEAAGLVKQLTFGALVLLQPELLDDYCAWLALAARAEPDGLGFLPDQRARAGAFAMDENRPLKDRPEERLLITAAVEDLVGRGLVLRQPTEQGEMLVFPSELRTDMPDYPGGIIREVVLTFEGPVRAIFATLAVCLTHAPAFGRERFFRDAALFRSADGELCGCAVDYPEPGNEAAGRLRLFFGPSTSKVTKLTFLRYVNRQLEQMALAGSIRRERVYQCTCGYVIPSDAVARRQARGKTTVLCPDCERQMPLEDTAAESTRPDPAVDEQLAQSATELRRLSREYVLPERERNAEFHVFLCHNHLDKPAVRTLAAKLRHEGILPWIDEEGIPPSGQFARELERALQTAPAAAVMFGPHGMGRWQVQEYYALLQRHVEHREGKGSKRVALIPTLLPGAGAEPELPMFLRGFDWIDFRPEDGLDNARQLQRLVHAILGEEAVR